jgi:hypothetical protein
VKKSRLMRFTAVAAVFGLATAYYAAAGQRELARIGAPLPGAPGAMAGAPQVDRERLLEDVRTLAAPGLGGRQTGTDGSRQAQAFLQARFAQLGLTPFGAGYVQPFAFTRTSVKGLLLPGRAYKTDYPAAANVIGYIRGTLDPSRFMVVSAHYDHLGTRDGKIYHGADDNASGVGAMLAVAAWFKAHPPRHSIVFAAFDAEELGKRGAQAFVAALPFPKERLVLNLNLDMVSHNDDNELFMAGTSHTPALRPLLEQVARRSTVGIKLGHDRPALVAGAVEDWTGSSDHSAFHEAGIAFLYAGVEDHPDYHAPSDTFERINPGFYARVAVLLVDLAATLDKNLATIK